MANSKEKYARLDMQEIMKKQHRTVSSSEALSDVVPPVWDKRLLSGEARVIISESGCELIGQM